MKICLDNYVDDNVVVRIKTRNEIYTDVLKEAASMELDLQNVSSDILIDFEEEYSESFFIRIVEKMILYIGNLLDLFLSNGELTMNLVNLNVTKTIVHTADISNISMKYKAISLNDFIKVNVGLVDSDHSSKVEYIMDEAKLRAAYCNWRFMTIATISSVALVILITAIIVMDFFVLGSLFLIFILAIFAIMLVKTIKNNENYIDIVKILWKQWNESNCSAD